MSRPARTGSAPAGCGRPFGANLPASRSWTNSPSRPAHPPPPWAELGCAPRPPPSWTRWPWPAAPPPVTVLPACTLLLHDLDQWALDPKYGPGTDLRTPVDRLLERIAALHPTPPHPWPPPGTTPTPPVSGPPPTPTCSTCFRCGRTPLTGRTGPAPHTWKTSTPCAPPPAAGRPRPARNADAGAGGPARRARPPPRTLGAFPS
jgi:hypothetical protein